MLTILERVCCDYIKLRRDKCIHTIIEIGSRPNVFAIKIFTSNLQTIFDLKFGLKLFSVF